MRQPIPSNVWTILKDFPNQQVLQDSGQISYAWSDSKGNLVLEVLNPAYEGHEPTWHVRQFADSWSLKEK